MIESALEYARRGFKVFPLHTPDASGRCSCHKADCDSIGKHPRTMSGLTDATDDEAQIRRWWDMWPDANIGIRTGEVSGFVAVDVDPAHGGTASLKQLLEDYGSLEEKYFAKTGGGGWHILFAHPGFYVKTTNSRAQKEPTFGNGIDIKGDGGYIVASPSLHVSGNRYAWGENLPERIPNLPQWLKVKLASAVSTPAGPIGDVEGALIPEGKRNVTMASLAGTMRRRGMGEAEIYVALAEVNHRCQPPLEDAVIRKISHSVSRYAPEDPAFVYPERVQMEGEKPEGVYFVPDFANRVRKLYRAGMGGGVSTGVPSLDYHYTVKPGQFTLITGIPSHGKTAVLDCILYHLAELHDWKFAITSIENQPLERHAAQLLSLYIGKPFGKGDVARMSESEMDEGLEWLAEHFVFILPNEGGCTVSGILDCIDWVDSSDFSVQGIVIDPWNELEHRRPPGMNETEYVSQSLARMRRFARSKEKHLWLVAHPTKLQKDVKTGNYPVPTLYDVSGSSHFYNKADNGLSVWRDVKEEGSATQIHVQKIRFRECGRPGMVELYFDVTSGRFTDVRPVYFSVNETEEVDF